MGTDYFALLQERRLPWGEADALKKKFLDLSKQCHPDRFHDGSPEQRAAAAEHYAQLNAAYQCLRNPKERLRHFLELERGAPLAGVAPIPENDAEFFSDLAAVFRRARDFSSAQRTGRSPLQRALEYDQALAWMDQLQNLASTARARLEQLRARLGELGGQWERGGIEPKEMLDRLETIYRSLSYTERWIHQLDELAFQLGNYGRADQAL